jgi:glycosyltransferase involved in cell wall biosynthesis
MSEDHTSVVSVVMPVFNGAGYLGRSLGSLRAQTFPGWELLAVDDGSTDGSYELLCRHADQDPRICPFRLPENRGPAAARNHALGHARGELIAYLDCDDEYYPDHLRHVHACRGKGDVFVFRYDAVDEGVGLLRPGEVRTWDPAEVRAFLMRKNIACPLGVAHRRGLLDKVGLFDESLHVLEDWDLWKRFARAGADFLFLPLTSGLYHIHLGSLTSTARLPRTRKAADGTPAPDGRGPERGQAVADAFWAAFGAPLHRTSAR